MSLRKVAGLLIAGGLAVGMIGNGVGASFFDSANATEQIRVGTLSCVISDATAGTQWIDPHTVLYTAPMITNSAPSSAPFSFTVLNNGNIPIGVSVTTGAVTPAYEAPPFSSLPVTPAASVAPVAVGGTAVFNAGLQWSVLSNGDENALVSVQYHVDCLDIVQVTSAALNYSGGGWGGWSCPQGEKVVSAAVTGGDYASLTLWRPGASVPGTNYPNTPFGYTYNTSWTPPEEGAIVQNDSDNETLVIVLQCHP